MQVRPPRQRPLFRWPNAGKYSTRHQHGRTERNASRGRPHRGALPSAGQSPRQEEAQGIPDGGPVGADGLRGVRAKGKEGIGGHERCVPCRAVPCILRPVG